MSHTELPLDLETVRQKLAAKSGREFWSCLEELNQAEGFDKLVEREFPRLATWTGPFDRRQFLTLLGASLALAGVTGCTHPPAERIFPYIRQPDEIVPGRALYFATAMPLAGYATGLVVESHEGRPTKVEGNSAHPTGIKPAGSPEFARYGPSDLFAQASTLGLYDPDRSQAVRYLGEISSWEDFLTAADSPGLLRNRQLRLRILTGAFSSPTLADQLRVIRERYPNMRWHVYEPAGRDNASAGARLAFGQDVETVYRFDLAAVVLALDADFLACGPGSLRYARDFASRRRFVGADANAEINRLYAVESTLTPTGAKADHRLALKSGQVETFARVMAARLGVLLGPVAGEAELNTPEGWLDRLLGNLPRGRSLVLAGDRQPPAVHALAHAMNARLGNVGQTVIFRSPVVVEPPGPNASLRDLVNDMNAGQVDVLVIVGGNPVYDAPRDLNFAAAMERVRTRIHLGLYNDETAYLCHWHIPEAHYLESWGDARAFDGTVSLIQPLIAPLYRGRSALELFRLLTGQPERTPYEIVQGFWRRLHAGGAGAAGGQRPLWQAANLAAAPAGDFEAWWRRSLNAGVVEGSQTPERQVTVNEERVRGAAPGVAGRGLEIVFRTDPTLFDGRFANNAWLQELPKPIVRLTWDNVALLSPATAVRLGFAPSVSESHRANGRVVALRYRGQEVRAPLWVLPRHADDSVTVHLGHGRTRAGRVGNNTGFNAYLLRTWDAPWFGNGLELSDTGTSVVLANTQGHHRMEGRDIVRYGTPAELRRPAGHGAGESREHGRTALPTLYPEREHPDRQPHANKWGMVIDLNLCTGCSACVVACQAENNIPVVGKDQVTRGREMHWLRIDSYFVGNPDQAHDLQTFFQPVPCMQCENAPCELVCPVEATVHSDDGLNDMVYNRCVGTRYCSNNCPYKVRRFNFLPYQDFTSEHMRLLHNPEVTVRSRGVMEKCTYCVQRIRNGLIDAHLEERSVHDGEIQTACQAACPAGAIVFGDLNVRDSRVARLEADPLNYQLLRELNTRPRTTYLPAVRNPNDAGPARGGE
jgi:molybdopterin-containing oxidoreductase family iron-sulfur binding subunit